MPQRTGRRSDFANDRRSDVRRAGGDRSARGGHPQLYCEQKKFKAKIQYADKLAIPYVIFLGEDEIAAGAATVKRLATGEQVSVPMAELPAFIRKGLSENGEQPVVLEK